MMLLSQQYYEKHGLLNNNRQTVTELLDDTLPNWLWLGVNGDGGLHIVDTGTSTFWSLLVDTAADKYRPVIPADCMQDKYLYGIENGADFRECTAADLLILEQIIHPPEDDSEDHCCMCLGTGGGPDPENRCSACGGTGAA